MKMTPEEWAQAWKELGEGKTVANVGKESILVEVECEYCDNPAKHKTRTRLSGALGRLEDTCNFHHIVKQDIREGGGNDHTNTGQRGTGGVPDSEEGTGGLHGAQSHQPYHQPGERT